MGSARYTVGALKEAFAERSYLSSMAFLTSAAAEGLQAQSSTPGMPLDQNSGPRTQKPGLGVKVRLGCGHNMPRGD